MRRFVVFILLPALILIGVIALSRAAADWRYVTTAAPGEVMFVAAFDGLLDDWEAYDDGQLSAQPVDGALRLTVNAFQSLPYSLARPHFADFDLRVTTRAVDGPLNNGFGVMFRMQDRSNNYQFLISSDGYYQVFREVDGVEKIVSNWIPSDVVHQGIGAANDICVVGRGDRFNFYVNGELVPLCIPDDPNATSTYDDLMGECIGGQMLDTLTDSALASGQVGVVAQSFNEAGVVVEFDNFVVTMPAE